MKFDLNEENLESNQIIEINTDNNQRSTPGDNIYLARNNVSISLEGYNAPLVSIYVIGYKNLEKYTKTCVECILEYTTNIDYELILIDNGSYDGTLEYFKSIAYSKKKIIKITKNLGAFFASNAGIKIARGRFIVGVANDIYVTKNWLENLLKCALSDERIGMVVPMSDNVSNHQSIDLNFTDFEDMQKKAAEFNISNPQKWHERLRLINPIVLFSKVCLDMIGMQDYGFFHDFADDDLAFRVRRAGYKAILCKDVFIHHAGNTTKDPEVSRKSLEQGRIAFKEKYYGIDAWDDVNNFESSMMSLITLKRNHGDFVPNVLGVDVRCGTPLLEAKNTLREKGIFNTRLSAFTTKAKYWLDLKTICDGKAEVDRVDYILDYFEHEKFDYVIVGQPLNAYNHPFLLVGHLLKLLNPDGELLVKLANSYDIVTLLKIIGMNIARDNDVVHHFSVDELNSQLKLLGYTINNIIIEQHRFNEDIHNFLKNIKFNNENAFLKATAKDYVIKIVRN
ncbi:glycosyltransferase family 2 protein [Desulfitobacterium sp.]|uniref:glycosyltransferase family 2 protein n=1 Tax=Desulfitobacterium sp. TaxID=49981 RepID=UPI002B20A03E|nr:glycosyltransferase family 2 protein [Desulfitobacterium sp.]MEA4902167.1 glycosyltransferase family 2 protein [Desulfitobacterium sp.]